MKALLDDVRSEAAAAYADAAAAHVATTARNAAQKAHDGPGDVVLRDPDGYPVRVRVRNASGKKARTGYLSQTSIDAVKTMKDEWRGAARRFARELDTLQEEVQTDRSYQRRGRFDRQRMKDAVKGSDRLYRRRGDDVGRSIAVSVQVDRSGSMGWDTLRDAVQATTTTAMALEYAEIPFELRSFGAQGQGQHLHKQFDRPMDDADLATMMSSGGSTPMSTAAMLSEASLSVREEATKFAFIMTDGAPNDGERTKQAISRMEAEGMTPIVIYCSPRDLWKGSAEQFNDLYGRNWEHIRSPMGLYQVVTRRLRALYDRGR
jgi:hypothetical protein